MTDQRAELKVTASTGFVATPVPEPSARRSATRGAASGVGLLPGLLDQGFDLVGTPHRITPAAGARRRAGAPKQVTAVARVGVDEDAVLLVEQDGVWTWHAPASREKIRPVAATRGAASRAVGREITFVLGADTDSAQRASAARGAARGAGPSRGLVGKVLTAGARLFVLKFLAPKITDKVMEHLESGVTPRLVQISTIDPESWSPVPAKLSVPGPRVLLFVHGTFSSTKGGFGHLAGHPSGVALLNSALSHYDVVLGYDHRTLSVDPQQNAMELLGMLRSLDWAAEPIFDVITHSRGALVTRSFAERVLPESDFRGRVDRIVFAAGVNAGTELANPKNWNLLLNLYTTLASSAARLIPDALASTITAEAIKGLGGLAKALISYAVDDDGIPGLAAMLPGGTFVTSLNEHQAHQPDSGTTPWYVIGADFEPHLNVGLPKAVIEWIADAGVDQLMRQANDLVVNTSSMGAIDVPVGTPSGFVDGDHYYPSSAGVFHTIYFNQAETADLIRDWLALPELTRVAVEDRARGAAPARGPGGRGRPGVVVRRSLPRMRRAEAASLSALEDRTIAGSFPSGSAIVLPRPGRSRLDIELPSAALDRLGVDLRTRAEPAGAAAPPPARRGGRRGATATAPPEPTPSRRRVESADVPLNVRASLPDHLAIGTVETLRCTLAREKLTRLAGAGDLVTLGVDKTKKLTVQVIAKAQVEIDGTDRADINVPGPDAPVDLFFDVRGVAVGEAEVHVIVRQGPVPLATLVVRPTVTTAARRRKTPGVTQAVADDVAPEAPGTCVKQWLRIVEQKEGDATRFLFDLQIDDPRRPLLVTARSEPLTGSKEDYVTQLYADIESRWLGNKADAAAFGLDLKAIGGEMFDQLIPPALGEVLWANRQRLRNLLVFSDEPYIPWELVHLKHDGELPKQNWTLGRLGLLRWRGGDHFPPDSIRHLNVRSVVPQYPEGSGLDPLPKLSEELAFLKKELGAKPVKADHSSVLKALQKGGDIDILHFSGHGDADSSTPAILLDGRLEDGTYVEDRLTDTTVAQTAHLASKVSDEQRDEGVQPRRAMVVLNSCQTGRLTPGLTHVGGFADAFLRAGAGVFISSLWSVFDNPAELFTETLYRSLLDKKTLAEATVAARDACGHDAAGDATWLAYVVYGNPCARFVE